MKTSSNFTTHQPSPEEVQAYTELQNKTTKTLSDAERALADLQKQIDDTAKKVESKN